MSTLLRLSTPRLEKAIERHGIKDGRISVYDLRKILTKRGMSDRDMHGLFFKLIDVLEPPSCPMTHCKYFGGVGAPMNCSQELVPGKCKLLRDFNQRQIEREKKKSKSVEVSV